MLKKLRGSSIAAVAMIALAFTACGNSHLTSANYAKVNNGMSQAEVEAILGPGTQQSSTSVAAPAPPVVATRIPGAPGAFVSVGASAVTNAKTIIWQDGQKIVTVTLINDKVMSKTEVGL